MRREPARRLSLEDADLYRLAFGWEADIFALHPRRMEQKWRIAYGGIDLLWDDIMATDLAGGLLSDKQYIKATGRFFRVLIDRLAASL